MQPRRAAGPPSTSYAARSRRRSPRTAGWRRWCRADDEAGQRVATWAGMRREGVHARAMAAATGSSTPGSPATPRVSEPEGFRALLNSFLPRKRAISQMLVRDPDDRVLLCQLTYKQDWDLPGGVVEVGESPQLAVAREVEEELGLDIPAGACCSPTGCRRGAAGTTRSAWSSTAASTRPPICSTRMVRQEREIRAAEFCTARPGRGALRRLHRPPGRGRPRQPRRRTARRTPSPGADGAGCPDTPPPRRRLRHGPQRRLPAVRRDARRHGRIDHEVVDAASACGTKPRLACRYPTRRRLSRVDAVRRGRRSGAHREDRGGTACPWSDRARLPLLDVDRQCVAPGAEPCGSRYQRVVRRAYTPSAGNIWESVTPAEVLQRRDVDDRPSCSRAICQRCVHRDQPRHPGAWRISRGTRQLGG